MVLNRMPEKIDALDGKKVKDVRVLSSFVFIFCRENHRAEAKDTFTVKDVRLRRHLDGRDLALCRDCRRLLSHGIAKLLLCPYDPKPMCKKCETQCYAPGYRQRVREVMKFSGLYLVKHGRLDLLVHYFF